MFSPGPTDFCPWSMNQRLPAGWRVLNSQHGAAEPGGMPADGRRTALRFCEPFEHLRCTRARHPGGSMGQVFLTARRERAGQQAQLLIEGGETHSHRWDRLYRCG